MTEAVRPATQDDVEDIVRLNREVQALHAEHDPGMFRADADPSEMAEFFATKLDLPGNELGIVGRRGKPLGYVWFEHQVIPGSTFMHPVSRLFIYHVAVTAAARRGGVGRRLMEWVEDRAKALGVGLIRLAYTPANEGAAIFYEQLGYTTERVILHKQV